GSVAAPAHIEPWPALGDFCEIEILPRQLAARALIYGRFKAPATNREAPSAARRRPRSTGAVDLGKPARNGSCQRVGILAEGPNRCKFMAAGAGQYQRRLSVLSAFLLRARRRSEWLYADRQTRAPTRGTSRPTFRSVAARRTGRARTSSEVRQTAKLEG